MTPTEMFDIKLPRKAYKVQVVDCSTETSKKGFPMLKHTLQLKGNEPLIIDGNATDINGIELMKFSVYTEKSLKFVNDERKALGLPVLTAEQLSRVDPNDYKGLEGWAICVSEATEKKNDVTGDVILNPYTKKPMIDWRRSLEEWIPRE